MYSIYEGGFYGDYYSEAVMCGTMSDMKRVTRKYVLEYVLTSSTLNLGHGSTHNCSTIIVSIKTPLVDGVHKQVHLHHVPTETLRLELKKSVIVVSLLGVRFVG